MSHRPLSLFLFLASCVAVCAEHPAPTGQPIPPEERRLSPAIFREGLKKRGLMELLDQHLKEFPPSSPSAVALMTREVKLSQFEDRQLPAEQRRAAIHEANLVLEKLIEENADDVRAFEWRLVLAHSLLYQEGEGYATNLLYFGGTPEDRIALAPLTQRALAALRELLKRLDAENQRVDALPPVEFERLESSGIVEKLDRLKPSAEFLLLWASFYDSLPRDEKDRERSALLESIIKTFATNTDWLSLPHDKSRVQVPALLLAGMAERRLRDYVSARQYFDRCDAAAGRISDDNERKSLRWAEMLCALEAGRNARDEERYDEALSHLKRLRAMPTAQWPDQYGIRLAAALLERSVLLARAQAAEKAGRTTDARNLREEGWRALARLAAEEPHNKAVLYSALYRTLAAGPQPVRPRDPVEMCALLAGTLEESFRNPEKREELLRQAIRDGEEYIAQASGAQRSVTPEILFQMGTAYYRLGDLPAAAAKMLEIARRHPNYGQAGQAAVLAVQLTAQICLDQQCPPKSANQEQYRAALETLLGQYPTLEASAYWRFFHAQLLEDFGDYTGAAGEYARVDSGQELYLEAAFRRVRAMTRAVAQSTANQLATSAEALTGANEVSNAYRELVTRATGHQSAEPGQTQDLVAQGRLWVADAYLLKAVNRPEQALELLVDFEQSFGAQNPHLGRVWQLRLRAYQMQGRLQEASNAVPAFVAADPRNAGPTLQSLYDSILADWRRHQHPEDEPPPDAEIMLLAADQIVKWSLRADVQTTPEQRRAAELQLAQTQLMAGNHARAVELFLALLPADRQEKKPIDEFETKAALGLAEALARGGEPEKALAEFNRLATRLPPENPIRWQALIGDLEVRTALHHPPAGILQVIAQQRRLFPDLGGAQTAAEFEKIERENIRIRDEQK